MEDVEYINSLPNELLIDQILPYIHLDNLSSLCSSSQRLQSLCQDERLWLNRINIEYPDQLIKKRKNEGFKSLYLRLVKDDTVPVYENGDIIGYVQLRDDEGFSGLTNRLGIDNVNVFLLGYTYEIYDVYLIKNNQMYDIDTGKWNVGKSLEIKKILIIDYNEDISRMYTLEIKNYLLSCKSNIPIYGTFNIFSPNSIYIDLCMTRLMKEDIYLPITPSAFEFTTISFDDLSPNSTTILINYILEKMGEKDKVIPLYNTNKYGDILWKDQNFFNISGPIRRIELPNNIRMTNASTIGLLSNSITSTSSLGNFDDKDRVLYGYKTEKFSYNGMKNLLIEILEKIGHIFGRNYAGIYNDNIKEYLQQIK
ncbi:F-box domain-containing protein [Orpheovirus IHUMI-LCC2]|uniref:F-box domain-containing protein n=1 Tax=Orpheovirus IHUMI-LCC2 TaxID=2023057 RepID=A0A2I2L3K2_9VIRU|nr:F-box domain-containing protein [Orpheovirus IHUMI-LCC2]SNW62101.1 F-box domain-containing protein [Orpheovirus IHUMI-LCC2]